ncbi:MAG: prephenate dehydratase [Syntrophorhabdaceae bacterium]|nr:prephenate dehydratase [Syntrophorhabdaceae bacterium]
MKGFDLAAIRQRIDMIDGEILGLLNQRMELALRAKRFKKSITDEEREREVFKFVRSFSHNTLTPQFSERLYREIIEESKRIQERDLKIIGFQGEHGAFSEVASLQYDPSLVPVACKEFYQVFYEVETGLLDYGIVPVENSLEGAVTQVNDLLIETKLKIVGEINIPIHHALLTLPDVEYRDLKVVYSHPQALAQCREFILRHKLEARPYYDTAGAAKMLARERPEACGVIASRLCADLYRLEVIKESIEDHPSNMTRFIVLSKHQEVEEGDKCSIIFSVKHEAGALFSVLRLFSEANINLTRIESRPTRNNLGSYIFFSDFEGSDKDPKVKEVLKKIRENTITCKFLGCYKSHKEADR